MSRSPFDPFEISSGAWSEGVLKKRKVTHSKTRYQFEDHSLREKGNLSEQKRTLRRVNKFTGPHKKDVKIVPPCFRMWNSYRIPMVDELKKFFHCPEHLCALAVSPALNLPWTLPLLKDLLVNALFVPLEVQTSIELISRRPTVLRSR